MGLVSGIVAVAFALYLIGLAVLSVMNRALVERFLRLFASSARCDVVHGAVRTLWMGHHRDCGRTAARAVAVAPQVCSMGGLFALGALVLGVLILYGASRAVL